MKRVRRSFRTYLKRIRESKISSSGTGTEIIPLGTDEIAKDITPEDSKYLLELLEKDLKKLNKIFISIILAMLSLLFGLGVFVVYSSNCDEIVMIGGSLGSLLVIIWKVRQLWLEMFIIKYASYVLPKLPPEQAAKFILHLYRFISKPFERKNLNKKP